MKILYVEDDLSGSIDRVIRLFSKYLDEKTLKDLHGLSADAYGATPDEIKKIIESTNIIEIADRFPDALRKIMHGYDQYACFIVDRNLIENPYEFRDVNNIDPNYTAALYDKFLEREGDYLLTWLATKTRNPEGVLQKFNFLSAFPTGPNDKIRGVENIETFIYMKTFTEEQFFEKDSPRIDDLKKKIDKIEVLNTQYDNRVYLNILRDCLDEKYADLFLRVLSEKDEKTRIGDSLKEIRILYEAMFDRLADIIPDMRNKFSDRYGNIKKDRETIFWLENNNHISVILKNFFISIWKICSTGGHPSSRFKPTIDTVNSLVYALKDVILWFGDQCKQKK
jgi:hypothetical protein